MKNKFQQCNTQWRLMRYLLTEGWTVVSEIKGADIRQGAKETVVFASPDQTKALRINSGMWKDFALYIDVARAIPDNPYLQNVGDDFFLDDGTYCVELERLYETHLPKIKDGFFTKQDDPISTQAKGQYVLIEALVNRPFKSSRPKMINSLLKRDNALKEAMTAIYAFHQTACEQNNQFDPYLDLHGRNFMIRKQQNGDQNVVIIDPFSYCIEGPSPDYQDVSNIFWRRKLGLPDHQDDKEKNWRIKESKCGNGILVLN